MRNCSKLLLAALLVAVAASGASANRLSVNEQSFVIDWESLRFDSAIGEVVCSLQVGGSFHARTMAKVAGGLVGSITSTVGAARCEGGTTLTALTAAPWHVRYGGFSGTLPRISALTLRIVGVSLQYASWITCLFTTGEAEPLVGTATVDVATGAIDAFSVARTTIDLAGEFICDIGGDAVLEASGRLTRPGGSLGLLLI